MGATHVASINSSGSSSSVAAREKLGYVSTSDGRYLLYLDGLLV
jgi:hypothetical protein